MIMALSLNKYPAAVIAIVLCLLLAPRKAHAYIDPGTGSFVIQILIATFVGILASIGLCWKKMTLFFGKMFAKRRDHAGST